MKKFISVGLALLLLVGCTTNQGGSSKIDPPPSLSYEDEDFNQRFDETKPTDEGLKNLWRFTDKSFSLLREEENRLYSPLSLYLALDMLKEGAEGETLEELNSLLGEGIDPKKLMDHLSVDVEDARLLIANSFWAQEGFALKEEFIQNLKDKFYATGQEVNLGTQKGMDQISSWIDENTMGKIKPQFEPNEDYRLFLVNTLYLKSAWQKAFDQAKTKEDTFYGSEESTIPFMNLANESGTFFQHQQFKMATKTLSQGMSMLFVLPEENVELKDLALEEILSSRDQLESASINWSMPKLHLVDDLELNETLEALGIKKAFTDQAEFNQLSQEPTFVSLAKQFTDLVLDEEGAEAAAATVIGMETTAARPEDPVEMKLNRPYLLVLMQRDVPLFIGEVYAPPAE